MSDLMAIWQAGGIISYPMALLTLVLFYACGCRYHLLGQDWHAYIHQRVQTFPTNNAPFFEELSFDLSLQLNQYQSTIKAIVTCAPLLGLLGTVIGMIETFESLADQALFGPQGGIAGGIAQALVTTQMGLVIALLGLVMGKYLQGGQQQILGLLAAVKGGGYALPH